MPARPTSNADKAAKGTARNDRHHEEPDFPVVERVPGPPDWLIDPEAVKEWGHKAKILVEASVLTETALSLLGQYCNMHAKAVQKWRLGAEPTAAEMTQLRLMATEFGFTPASRFKVGSGKKGEGNKFMELVG
jgi:phage terminase small subunit